MKKTLKQLLSVVKTHFGGFFLATSKHFNNQSIFNVIVKDNKKYLNIDLSDFEKIIITNNGIPIKFTDALLVESKSHIAFNGESFWMQPEIENLSKENLDKKRMELSLPTFDEIHHEFPLNQYERLLDIKNRNKHNHVVKKYPIQGKCKCHTCNH